MSKRSVLNLSRRHALRQLLTAAAAGAAGAASVPVLALPAVATAVPVADATSVNPQLLALGERLKAAWAKVSELDPSELYEACRKAAGFEQLGDDRTEEQRKAAEHRFKVMASQNGYHRVSRKWNAACRINNQIARAIMEIPSTERMGDGIRAAAALVLNDDCENAFEMADVLWEMAARAGFTRPEEDDDAVQS
jgi:hypothetical protein